MDSDLFDSYEVDFQQLSSSIGAKLSTEVRELKGEPRKALLRRIENELEEADEILAQMEIEVQTSDQRQKGKMQIKLRSYKSDITRFKADLKSVLATSNRDELLSRNSGHTAIDMDSPDDSLSTSQAQRTKLLSTTDKLTQGQRRLEDSHRIALETEDVGSGILRDLRGQRETLVHTRDNLYEADGSIGRASNTLNGMVRRMYQQKLVTYGIIAILVLLILYVLYSKVLK